MVTGWWSLACKEMNMHCAFIQQYLQRWCHFFNCITFDLYTAIGTREMGAAGSVVSHPGIWKSWLYMLCPSKIRQNSKRYSVAPSAPASNTIKMSPVLKKIPEILSPLSRRQMDDCCQSLRCCSLVKKFLWGPMCEGLADHTMVTAFWRHSVYVCNLCRH